MNNKAFSWPEDGSLPPFPCFVSCTCSFPLSPHCFITCHWLCDCVPYCFGRPLRTFSSKLPLWVENWADCLLFLPLFSFNLLLHFFKRFLDRWRFRDVCLGGWVAWMSFWRGELKQFALHSVWIRQSVVVLSCCIACIGCLSQLSLVWRIYATLCVHAVIWYLFQLLLNLSRRCGDVNWWLQRRVHCVDFCVRLLSPTDQEHCDKIWRKACVGRSWREIHECALNFTRHILSMLPVLIIYM